MYKYKLLHKGITDWFDDAGTTQGPVFTVGPSCPQVRAVPDSIDFRLCTRSERTSEMSGGGFHDLATFI